ncbi:hypothetical protein DPMN_092405 [Dreissena polymorpha]|uniref:Uncharacterized protein n=1 Tax=Dreissena polymorpha TaxID=45954 RepID=A0A9D4L1X9_DREPO|nr:hypothetical protein DPMN_092405 [Dreissena polymorpha]
MRPIGPNKSAQVSSLSVIYSEMIIATSGSYYGGNGAKYGPVSVPSATLSPEAMALRRHQLHFWHAWPYRAEQVCQVSVALGHLLREIIATSGSY